MTTVTDTNGIDAAAVIGTYFAEQTAKARAAEEKANAEVAEAEKEEAVFTERQELPPTIGVMKQGWMAAVDLAVPQPRPSLRRTTRSSEGLFVWEVLPQKSPATSSAASSMAAS
ncbi:hypothetical protein [Streptomyces europaeiscabiei]|uniref:hypothetical protein n=1 Tax=Streptomyces europaeiscabiei TaxID=146819 RepID=UPI000E67E5DD|nr:hypothetical protein [Streptomyces europaeiscabiei]